MLHLLIFLDPSQRIRDRVERRCGDCTGEPVGEKVAICFISSEEKSSMVTWVGPGKYYFYCKMVVQVIYYIF